MGLPLWEDEAVERLGQTASLNWFLSSIQESPKKHFPLTRCVHAALNESTHSIQQKVHSMKARIASRKKIIL
jgi:hypothetical protein